MGAGSGRVGDTPPRRDAWAKATGRTLYLADMPRPGDWLGGVVRSEVACGRLLELRRDPDFDWSRVTMLTAADLNGPNAVRMIRDDYPLLADGRVAFASQALALIAAPDAATLRAALAAVMPVIDPEPPLLDVEQALAADRVIFDKDNLVADYVIECGDLEDGFARADRVVEGVYRTGLQEHLYIEPQGVVAEPTADGGVRVIGSMQCPYYVVNALAYGLGLPREKVTVRQSPTGGAFGGKEDYPSILAMQASVLALAAGRPVKMIHDRREDVLASTKRHPSRTRHRTAVAADGTLLAADIDLVLDAGAFASLSQVVLSRAVLHATGVYRIPAVRIRGRAVATNTPPSGAFRGFGVPQALFAIERHIDRIALETGLDPLTVRRRNILREGDSFPYGQTVPDAAGASLVLERAAELCALDGPRRDVGADDPSGRTRIGTGLSVFLHGGGFTGDGEDRIAAEVRVRLNERRGVDILVSSVEMGQGAATVLPMIAAQALGLPLEKVDHAVPDTAEVPDSGPTVASRTTMVVGRIVVAACRDLAAKLTGALAEAEGLPAGSITFADGRFSAADRDFGDFAAAADRVAPPLEGEARYEPPAGQKWNQQAHHGAAYQAYSWGCNVVEAAVDIDTMEVTPLRVTAVVEIGKAVHPVLAAGQVEGGVLQALGWGHVEQMKTENGCLMNDSMATYIIPTAMDAPDYTVEIAEMPSDRGPYGAKGLGELPMNGGAPALAAAIQDAVGLFAAEAPVASEDLIAMRAASGEAKR